MEEIARALPNLAREFLDHKRYFDAISACKSSGVDPAPIHGFVDAQIRDAFASFSKGDHHVCLDIFISTIGLLEPSVVISKLYQPKSMPSLVKYLVELHQRGFANRQLTELLFTLIASGQFQSDFGSFISFIESVQAHKSQPPPHRSKSDRAPKPVDLLAIDGQRFLQNFDAELAMETLSKQGLTEESSRLSRAIGISMTSVYSLIEQHRFAEAASKIFEY